MKLSTSFMAETFINAVKALPLTLSLALVPFLAGSVFAFLLALAQIRQMRFWGKFASFYVSLIRGMPMVVLVLLLYNTLPVQLASLCKAMGSSFNVYRSIPVAAYAYFIFTLSAVSFLIEIFRSAIGAVDKGQLEAAYGVGLSGFQAYTRILLPQALRGALPNLCNLMVALVKNTSLAFMMTVKDLTQTAKLGAALNYRYAEAYIVILAIYILLCLSIEGVFWFIERRFHYEYKERTGIKGVSQ